MSAPGIAEVALIGLGRMGAPIGRSMLRAGLRVFAFDRDQGARSAFAGAAAVAGSAEEAVRRAEAVVLLLPDGRAVREAVLGASGFVGAMPPGALLVDMGSSAPEETRALAGEVEKRGLAFVDAPVSGGVRKAEAGTLAVMAGGSQADVARARPIFDAVGETVFHVGPVGAGHAAKALNNLLSAIGLLAAAEVMTAGCKAGIAPETLLAVLNSSSGRNNSTETKFAPFVLSRSFDAGFGLSLMVKDMRTAVDLAEGLGVPLPLGRCALDAFVEAEAALGEGADHTEVIRLVEKRAGATLLPAARSSRG